MLTIAKNANEYAYRTTGAVNISGSPSRRLMIVLRTNGCAYDINKQGCKMCDFAAHAIDRNLLRVSTLHLMRQFESALEGNLFGPGKIEQIDLLTLGSFLHDWEIGHDFRASAFERINSLPGVRKVVIESRAEYINKKILDSLRAKLRHDQALEVGLGVESMDEHIRNDVLHKGLSSKSIDQVIKTCADSGTEFQAYLLIKPLGLSDREAVNDAVTSAERVAELCSRAGIQWRIAFEPVFITSRTPLETAYLAGTYQIVNLWSVLHVLLRTSGCGIRFVGMSDENLSFERKPRGCDLCTTTLLSAIEGFNASQDHQALASLSCGCREMQSQQPATQ